MTVYEEQRLENIRRNQLLLEDLKNASKALNGNSTTNEPRGSRPKKRKVLHEEVRPTRSSARLASTPSTQPSPPTEAATSSPPSSPSPRPAKRPRQQPPPPPRTTIRPIPLTPADLAALRASWTSWTPSAPPPTRDPTTQTLHFPSHPTFTPNLSPEQILRAGAFGGTYFRPLRSAALATTIADDWRELPASWLVGLDVPKVVASSTYDAGVNAHGAACGQSIEAWEAAGWIAHEADVRGWFQWFCRFCMGRRCDDDERQVGRWARCVGAKGRWRRGLLKRYVDAGVRTLGGRGEEAVSAVVKQTCLHWGYAVSQADLDEYWRSEGA